MPTTLNQYTLGRELGSGVSCKVKLAKDAENTRYAIKILKQDAQFDELIQTEVDALKLLDHPNVIKLVEVNQGTQIHSKKGTKEVKFMVLELAQGGELFDFVALGGALSEETARFFFKQMMEALKHCHDQGIAHRDLKPENIMLDKNFNVKIADFGFAAPVQGRDGSGMLETQLGTVSYMAPEIHRGEQYKPQPVDVFAAAIILFVILTQRPPFASAHPEDVHYKLISEGGSNAQIFWSAHAEAEDGKDIYSDDFKDLFEKAMALDADSRITVDEILDHPWLNGTMTSLDEIQADFKQRKELVDKNQHDEREAKRKQRADINPSKARRNVNFEKAVEEDEEDDPRKLWGDLEIPEYDLHVEKNTRFFSTGIPLDLFLVLTTYLESKKIDYTMSSSKLQVKFETVLQPVPSDDDDEEEKKAEDDEEEGTKVQCIIRIFKCDESGKNNGKYCVDFTY